MSQGIVFIADFIRSWSAYGFSPQHRDGIAKQCGLICTVDEPRAEEPTRIDEERIIEVETDDENDIASHAGIEWQRSEQFDGDGPAEAPAPIPPRPPATTPQRRDDMVTPPASAAKRLEPIVAQSDYRSGSSSWWRNLEPLAPSPERTPADEPPAPEPLLRRAWQRAIITEIAATYRAEGEPDLPALVGSIARQKVPKQIPRQHVKSNRVGLYCYLDVGDGMGPFAADQKEFVQELQKIIGKDLLSLKRFRGTPLKLNSQDNIAADLLPVRRPVLILSDLGIGSPRYSTDPAPVSEWLKFASMLTEAANSVVALVPYPRARWPMELQQAMKILFWDPSTHSGLVAAALRPSRTHLR